MKYRRTIPVMAATLVLTASAALMVSCLSFDQGDTALVARRYDEVVRLIDPEQLGAFKYDRNDTKQEVLIAFWKQAAWRRGRRCQIRFHAVDADTTAFQGWVANDGILPGYNVFTKRSMEKGEFIYILEGLDNSRRPRNEIKVRTTESHSHRHGLNPTPRDVGQGE